MILEFQGSTLSLTIFVKKFQVFWSFNFEIMAFGLL
jgi:hypothetical protein